MKKRKTITIIAIAAALAVLLFPVRMNLKDGGSVSYKSLLYEVTEIHQLNHNVGGIKPYIDGLEIKILGMTVYIKTNDTQVIGGSDGPTSIFVTDKDENTNTLKKPIRMINVNGKLYYDTGKVSKNTPRCGTMDGELKQVGAEHEIPKKDNECNFEGAEGYQHATSITKEIPIDGEWVIFKLFDVPEPDMDVFKYCFYIKGHLPNAAKDTELVVITDNINYSFEDHKAIFSSQYNPNPDGKVYHSTCRIYGDTDKWGITLSAKDVTNKGLTILCEQFGGSPTGELQTGEEFSLEYSDNGEWKPLSTNPLIDYAWHQVAYMVKKNDITKFKVEWEWLYGELKPGYYKLKKEFTDFRATGDFDDKMYELYFKVE